jgi:hypothetical protein
VARSRPRITPFENEAPDQPVLVADQTEHVRRV